MSDLKEMIRQANETAVNKLKNAQPYWVDIKPAHEVLGIDKYTLLHAGPPIAWEEMCGPMRGAIVAVLKYEGLAENDEEALALAGSGKIKYEPCHHHNAVGPMTGVTSYSMPMICVLNKENGNYAYSTINEGTGKGIRFGTSTRKSGFNWSAAENHARLLVKRLLSAVTVTLAVTWVSGNFLSQLM